MHADKRPKGKFNLNITRVANGRVFSSDFEYSSEQEIYIRKFVLETRKTAENLKRYGQFRSEHSHARVISSRRTLEYRKYFLYYFCAKKNRD